MKQFRIPTRMKLMSKSECPSDIKKTPLGLTSEAISWQTSGDCCIYDFLKLDVLYI